MKRYLAFAGSVYYPSGGWKDFVGDYSTLGEAKAACDASNAQDGWPWMSNIEPDAYLAWAHVVDTVYDFQLVAVRGRYEEETVW